MQLRVSQSDERRSLSWTPLSYAIMILSPGNNEPVVFLKRSQLSQLVVALVPTCIKHVSKITIILFHFCFYTVRQLFFFWRQGCWLKATSSWSFIPVWNRSKQWSTKQPRPELVVQMDQPLLPRSRIQIQTKYSSKNERHKVKEWYHKNHPNAFCWWRRWDTIKKKKKKIWNLWWDYWPKLQLDCWKNNPISVLRGKTLLFDPHWPSTSCSPF